MSTSQDATGAFVRVFAACCKAAEVDLADIVRLTDTARAGVLEGDRSPYRKRALRLKGRDRSMSVKFNRKPNRPHSDERDDASLVAEARAPSSG